MNEQQNTLRALGSKPLLVTSRLCRFGWHDWTKWQPVTGFGSYQERYCSHCNLRTQKYTM